MVHTFSLVDLFLEIQSLSMFFFHAKNFGICAISEFISEFVSVLNFFEDKIFLFRS